MKLPDTFPAQHEAGRRPRAFELDALRGFAVLMMMLHHFAFDVRYMLGIPWFGFQESTWFSSLLRPFFVAVFLGISGVCCSFSRDNRKRGVRMLVASIVLTVVSFAGSRLLDVDLYIYFNVIHLITVGTFLFALLEWLDRKRPETRPLRLSLSVLLSAVFLYLGGALPAFGTPRTDWLLPLGRVTPQTAEIMADYMPVLPWLGFFFVGAAVGLALYKDRGTLFPRAAARLSGVLSPLSFMGRHALVFYLLHQPVLLGALYLLRHFRVI